MKTWEEIEKALGGKYAGTAVITDGAQHGKAAFIALGLTQAEMDGLCLVDAGECGYSGHRLYVRKATRGRMTGEQASQIVEAVIKTAHYVETNDNGNTGARYQTLEKCANAAVSPYGYIVKVDGMFGHGEQTHYSYRLNNELFQCVATIGKGGVA